MAAAAITNPSNADAPAAIVVPAHGSQDRSAGGGSGGVPVRVGFLPLTDAAPLIAAYELGYFRDAGLAVTLDRQIGWANVRDKLLHGHLDASHALLGMPVCTAIDAAAGHVDPLVSVMSLSRGGNGITLSRRLVERGVTSATLLHKWINDAHNVGRPVLAHVFRCSTHHYLLRDWLAAGGVDPDRDVRLCVIPPEQMADHMGLGQLDGFCVGEPWNTLAARGWYGSVVAATTDVQPDHPEKVLAVATDWAARNGAHVTSMVAAVLRACAWCDDAANGEALAEMLSASQYVDVPADVILAGLRSGPMSVPGPKRVLRPAGSGGGAAPSFAVAQTFPSGTHAAWIANQMVRWGHAAEGTDVAAIARACTDASYYRRAAAMLADAEPFDVPLPDDDFPAMPVRNGGVFDLKRAATVTAAAG